MHENLDTGIGKILDMVETLGKSDNTYIILMSDNGGVEFIPPVKNKFDHPSKFSTHTRNYPLRGGKWILYEGGIRVPFFVIGPGIKAGSQCDVPVNGWDLLPTFSDLAGNKYLLPENLDGTSIRPLLEKGNNGSVQRNKEELVFHYYGKSHSSIRFGNYKLIKFWDLNRIELYNLKYDIGELSDLSKKEPHKAAGLESKLMAYLKAVHAEILYTPDIKIVKPMNGNNEN